MGFRAIFQDAHEHAPHIGQQQLAGSQIGIPLYLDRVRDVEAFGRHFGIEDKHRCAGIAAHIDQAKARPPRQPSRRISACGDGFFP